MIDKTSSIIEFWNIVIYLLGRGFEKSLDLVGYFDIKWKRNILNRLHEAGYMTSESGNELILSNSNTDIYLRYKTSDFLVAEQILLNREYSPVINYFLDNGIKANTIIDAGANIGLSSYLFLSQLAPSRLLALEPDLNNYIQLKKNLSKFRESFIPIQKALWNKNETLYFDYKFRDGREWSIRTTNLKNCQNAPCVDGVAISDLIFEYQLSVIDLLKIDIEGGENSIFCSTSDLSFLTNTRVLAIEIHDEFDCRKKILKILNEYGFKLFQSGELTIAFNTKMI